MPAMLKYRVLFGTLMVVGLLVGFWLDDWLDSVGIAGTPLETVFLGRHFLPAGLLMLLGMLLLIVLTSREVVRIFHVENVDASYLMVGLSGVTGALLIYLIPHDTDSQQTIAIYASFMVMIFIASLVRHSWRGRTQGAVTVAAVTMFALIYLGTLPGFYLAIRRWHSAWVVAAVIAITKSCDVGAYATGRLFGKHKLIPWLSPGKTWEGLAGGVVMSGLLATLLVALANYYDVSGRWMPGPTDGTPRVFVTFDYPLWLAMIGGLIIGFVGQVGDLTASLFKRDAGIKDSGRSIPGFGGLLDVIDSPILVAPLAYWLLHFGAELGTD